MFYKLLEQLSQCIQTVLISCRSFACRQLMSVVKICSYLQVNCGMLGCTGTMEAVVQHLLFKSENSPPWATKLCKMRLLVPSAWTHHFFQLPQAWLKSTLLQPSSTDVLNQGGHFCLSCGLMEMFPQQHWSPWMRDSPILQTRVEKGCNLSK